jgi:hypothetical protein
MIEKTTGVPLFEIRDIWMIRKLTPTHIKNKTNVFYIILAIEMVVIICAEFFLYDNFATSIWTQN